MATGDVKIGMRGRGFSADIRTGKIRAMFLLAPDIVWFHARDQHLAIMLGFRKRWLANKDVNFRDPDKRMAPIRGDLPEAGANLTSIKSIFFVLRPKNRKREGGQTLEDIAGDFFTRSEAWEGLEFGGTFGPKRGQQFVALPIGITKDSLGRTKSKWSTPERFKRTTKRGGAKALVSFRLKSGALILWHKKKAPRGATDSQGRARQFIYLPAFQLVSGVKRRARFRFFSTWAGEDQKQRERLAKILDLSLKDMVDGKRR